MIPYQKRMRPYIQRVLAKILLCRTPILKGHVYECPECGSRWDQRAIGQRFRRDSGQRGGVGVG